MRSSAKAFGSVLAVFALLPLATGIYYFTEFGMGPVGWLAVIAATAFVALAVFLFRYNPEEGREVEQSKDRRDNWFNNGINGFAKKHPVVATVIVIALFVLAISLRVFF